MKNKKIATKVIIILLILICLQYILAGVHIGKDSERLLSSVLAASTDENNSNSEELSNEGYLRLSNTNDYGIFAHATSNVY